MSFKLYKPELSLPYASFFCAKGVLYILADLYGVPMSWNCPALITQCFRTGTKHAVFYPPHIPRNADYFLFGKEGVLIKDRRGGIWACGNGDI